MYPLFREAFAGPKRRMGEMVPLLHAFHFCLGMHRPPAPRSALGRMLRALAEPPWLLQAAECGVYQGASLVSCARLARAMGRRVQFTGLDTFAGLPTLSDTDRSFNPTPAALKDEPLFKDTSMAAVQQFLEQHGVAAAVRLVPGLFGDTLHTLAEQRYHFVHIDCDLYEPHLECLEYFYPRMAPGGIVFFDDYHSVEFPMARGAVDHFMSGRPETLLHLQHGPPAPNAAKAFFIKS